MKNKKFFLRIYIPFFIIIFISMTVLSILGKKERIGYLSEFKINTDKTLELNNFTNINETSELFDNELDYDAITNYILTNEYITNYAYDFRIKYYDKVFRNSDIYGVYLNLNKLPEYMQSAKMNDNTGTPFGNLISTKIIDIEKIDNIKYILKLKYNISFIIFIFVIIFILYYFKIFHIVNEFLSALFSFDKKLKLKDYINILLKNSLFVENDFKYIFLIIVFSIFSIIEIIYRFNLFFPGNYFFGDFYYSILPQSLGIYKLSHIYPVFISFFFRILNILFGNHVWYYFLINLILWHIGLLFLTMTVYHKTKSIFSILLFFLTFLSNIWWFLPDLHKDYTYGMFIWVYLNMILFIEVKQIKSPNILLFIIFILFIFSFLWSHTAIVTLAPLLIYFVHKYTIKYYDTFLSKKYIISFIKTFSCVLVFLLFVYILYPSLLTQNNNKCMTWHISLHDILSISVLIDKDLLPESSYGKKINFEIVKNKFSHNTIDNLIWNSDSEYNLLEPNVDNFKLYWLKTILSYPKEYLYHKYIFAKNLLINPGIERIGSYSSDNSMKYYDKNVKRMLPDNELNIIYTEKEKNFLILLEKNIYNLLFIKPLYFFIISLICFILSIVFLIKIKKFIDLSILILSMSASNLATVFISILYAPHIGYRYIFVIVPIGIISIIASIILIIKNKIITDKMNYEKS